MIVVLALAVAAADYTDPELTAAARRHWSFVAPRRHAPPVVKDAGRVRTPIDRFVLAKLEAAGRTFSPEADRRAIIRRLCFDLTGLPPTPAEIDAFVNDTSPDAYEKLVDRLLGSPHYGERWGQHWLDVVRFGESNGYELDGDRPNAWQYRDWVVKVLNEDKPFDRFITEQVAGDLLAKGREPRDAAELLAATGLHRCGPVHVVSGNLDPVENRNEVLTEMANGVGSAVLGLTVGCARCHDHKFDPISLGDYYRLQAFFAGTRFKEASLASPERKLGHAVMKALADTKLNPIKKRIEQLEAPTRQRLKAERQATLSPEMRAALDTPSDKRTKEQKKLAGDAKPLLNLLWDEVIDAMPVADREKRARLKAEQVQIEEAVVPPPLPATWSVSEDQQTPTHHLLKRGGVRTKAGVAKPAVLRVAEAGMTKPADRRDLAKWLTDPANPLTARVIVNRLWQHHFGRGIVGTPNDFGTRGERPTHPELLDWLALDLIDGGWSLKRMHRLMVTSTAYRQVSGPQPDPLVGRQARQRLDAEAIRDAMLTAAGTLHGPVGGPSVRVPLESEVYDLIFTEGEPVGLWPITRDARQHDRRSLYLLAKRNVRQPLLEAFDQPDALGSCAMRGTSTFAPQALILMNGPLAREQARRFAASVTWADRVGEVYRRAVGREPTAAERTACDEFLSKGGPLSDLCLAAFNLNEFVYVE